MLQPGTYCVATLRYVSPALGTTQHGGYALLQASAPQPSSATNSDDGAALDCWHCVVCNKTFRSEAAMANHERFAILSPTPTPGGGGGGGELVPQPQMRGLTADIAC